MNLTGDRYGRLLVLSEAERLSNRRWLCICDCGQQVTVAHSNLRGGHTKSCGCLAKELLSARRKVHGLSGERIYICWLNMRSRCNNPEDTSYQNYGGRGITYDPSWEDFEEFHKDMGQGYADHLTLERIDVDGDYCKSNCKWVSYEEQNKNKRMMKNNTSGSTGVYLKRYRGFEYWTAYWNEEGKKKSKSFSVLKYGREARRMAEEHRNAKVKELGYSEKHGK